MLKLPLFRSFVAFLIAAAFLAFVFHYVGFEVLLETWLKVDLKAGIIAMLLMFASYAFRALRILDYFRAIPGLSFWVSLKLMLYHNLLNNFLPMRTGEVSFPVLMSHYFRINVKCSIPALIWFRILDLHSILCIGFSAVILQWIGIWPALGFLIIAAPLPIFVISLRRWWLQKLFTNSNHKIAKTIQVMVEALPSNLSDVYRSQFWTWTNWAFKLAALAWVLASFSESSPATATWSIILGELTSVLPIHSAGGFGTYEGGIIAGLIPSGETFDSALEAAIHTHLFVLVVSLTGGALALLIPYRAHSASSG